MFALDALLDAYPNARFLWSHRDPAKVLGSVCSLIHYTRSWSSDRDDATELGPEQTERWAEACARAMDFRAASVTTASPTWRSSRYRPIRSARSPQLRPHRSGVLRPIAAAVDAVGRCTTSRARTAHTYALTDFGIDADKVRRSSSTSPAGTTSATG